MARPRELANILGQLDEIVPGMSLDRATAIASSVAAAAPAIKAALGFLDGLVAGDSDLEAKLKAAIAKASTHNRSAAVAAELQAELDALGRDTERP